MSQFNERLFPVQISLFLLLDTVPIKIEVEKVKCRKFSIFQVKDITEKLPEPFITFLGHHLLDIYIYCMLFWWSNLHSIQ